VAAVGLFALNITMTMRRGEKPRRRAAERDNLSDWPVADVAAIPGALEVLLEAGFTPLANPALRESIARTLTLSQACRLRSVPIAPLLSRLDPLRRRADGRHAGGTANTPVVARTEVGPR
jgi:hypothetical protein